MPVLSPIQVELLRNGLTSICDEMFLAIMKSAYSTNIKRDTIIAQLFLMPKEKLLSKVRVYRST